jgi:hypothetical protein
MSNHSESPLIRKIRLLRAKASAEGTTEAEAASFAAKVQELLAANGLSMSDIKDNDDVERGEVGKEEHHRSKWVSPARQKLLRTVCRYYMCEAIGPGRGGTHWSIVGRPHNVLVALEMTDYLIKTTVRLSNEYGRRNIGANVIDFRRGCMVRLCERLLIALAEQAKQKPEFKSDGNPGNLPALFVSEREQNARFIAQTMKIRTTSDRGIKQGSDAMEGRKAADGISLHQQVGGGSGGRLMIGKK